VITEHTGGVTESEIVPARCEASFRAARSNISPDHEACEGPRDCFGGGTAGGSYPTPEGGWRSS
jgi:hypothetical protein